MLGGTGADKLTAGDGADALAGGDGDDVISAGGGDDQVNGGDGDDEIDGGAGADVVEAGLGVDTVAGGDGADDLRVRDGVADTVRCGAGEDKVDADTLDDIALDCEDVRRLPTPVPELGGTTGRDRVAPAVRVGGPTVQRGHAACKLFATSSERGTISASGFVEIARPGAADQRGGPARRRRRRGRGADRKLPGRASAPGGHARMAPRAQGHAAPRRRRHGPGRQLQARQGARDRAASLTRATSRAGRCAARWWRCPRRRAPSAPASPSHAPLRKTRLSTEDLKPRNT